MVIIWPHILEFDCTWSSPLLPSPPLQHSPLIKRGSLPNCPLVPHRHVLAEVPDDAREDGPAALHRGHVAPALPALLVERDRLEEGPVAAAPRWAAPGRVALLLVLVAPRAVQAVALAAVLQTCKKKKKTNDVIQDQGSRPLGDHEARVGPKSILEWVIRRSLA